MNHHRESQRISSEIKRLFDLPPNLPPHLQSSLARYACVLTSSYLEASLRTEILSFVNMRVHDRHVIAFVQSSLQRLRNPKIEHIVDLIGRFGTDVKESLSDSLDSRDKDSINSVYGHRNLIVHGRNSTLSLANAKQYYSDSEIVVKKIKKVLSDSVTPRTHV